MVLLVPPVGGAKLRHEYVCKRLGMHTVNLHQTPVNRTCPLLLPSDR